MKTSKRREFLAQVGKISLIGATTGAVVGCPQPPPEDETPYSIPPLPWTYAELDVELIRKRGHYWYYSKDCCGGAFTAIVKTLAEVVGDPFDKVPCDMMLYGAGGVAGFGSLCGALNGAGAAMGLVFDKATVSKLLAELISWYNTEPFPSDTSNRYAQNHEFLVSQYKTDAWLPSNSAGSELCHVSVTKWCLASGFASGSVERSERCGRLTGDVAAKAVELMNAQHAGTFQSVNPLPSSFASCALCHYQGTNFEAGQFTRGKTDCEQCHVDAYTDMSKPPHSWWAY